MKYQLEKSRPPTMRPMTGMMRSLTSESTIFPNAPPMITPTARSTTLPLTANSRNSLANDMDFPPELAVLLDRGFARFAGANAHYLLDVGDEDLAVADLAGACGLDDRFERALDQRVADDDLNLDLGQEIDHVFGAAIELSMALLAPEALDFGDRQTGDADFGKRLAYFIEFERLDDRFDFFHGSSRRRRATTASLH